MRTSTYCTVLVLMMCSCRKDSDLTETAPNSPAHIDQILTVSEVAGIYYGRYAYGWYYSIPWSNSYSFLDTMDILVRPDTTAPINPTLFYAAHETFTLNEDSTISNWHGGVTSHYGRFYMSNDTLRLQWQRHTFGDFGDGSSSSFSGTKH